MNDRIIQDKYAIVFPGQGSQKIGMLQELAVDYSEIKNTFNEAADVLGYNLWDLVQNGPEDKLNQTEFTQPALLAADVAVWRVWNSRSKEKPVFFAGHSLGEYAALVASEAMSFIDAVKMVQARARFMQSACQSNGAMIAIVGLTNEVASQICRDAAQNEILEIANYNSIGQVVLAGNFSAAKRAEKLAKNVGAKVAKILPVSVPSHCTLMKSAAEELAKILDDVEIKTPQIPVMQNAEVVYYNDPEKIRAALVRQLYASVRWVETIQLMIKNGVKTILECGPGKVLTGLNKRISKEIVIDSIGDPQKIKYFL